MGTIITRKQGNKIYYLYHETYREKIDKKDQMKGKINWIGALVPSHHKDLIDEPVDLVPFGATYNL